MIMFLNINDVLLSLTQSSVHASAVSGTEDLCPSLRPWLEPFSHRASKELHLHPASIRLDIVLLATFHSLIPLSVT